MRHAIYGSGGFGREVCYILADADVVFVDDDPRRQGKIINGVPCYSFDHLINEGPDRLISVAVANPQIRSKLVAKCQAAGFEFHTALRDPTNYARSFTTIGEGAILCGNGIISPNTTIGRHFHMNVFGYISHDCRIGDFVTFYPSVRCSGNVTIEDYAFIGSNAVIKQGVDGDPLVIGKGAVIGMGAVVTKSVPPGVTMIGNPAREMGQPIISKSSAA